ncbi:hypothetical protein [Deinococcus aluminii]|uniref:Uncharacterized protein n=1 Tax=Deinococcus aluminii TaxID=1656885 RepID=A0ABP9XEU6_9DEIO
MRRFLLLAAVLASPAAAQTATPADAVQAVAHAGRQVIAYLPDLQTAPLAQALKKAASSQVRVYLIAPRNAHMISGSFLPSVALANAEKPPLPLSYHFRTLNAPAFVIVDNRLGFLGSGLTTGGSDVRPMTASEIAPYVKSSTDAIKTSPAQPARVLIKERYGLKY